MPKAGQPWTPHFLEGHPLFALWEPFAHTLRTPRWPTVDSMSEAIERGRAASHPAGAPLRMVEMVRAPRRRKPRPTSLEELYDGSIALRGEVPCLAESYHDLFNALVFMAFPRSKRALHLRQYQALRRHLEWHGTRLGEDPLPGQRSREQDALTIFDEGGAVIAMTHSAHDQWRRREAQLNLSAQDGSGGVWPILFGHALLEHLMGTRRPLRASAVVAVVEPSVVASAPGFAVSLMATLDAQLARRLADPSQFCAPGADAVLEIETEDRVKLSRAKPGWGEFLPEHRERWGSAR